MSNYLRVTAPSGLRIRSGPGTDCDELDAVPFGTVLETSGEEACDGWAPILLEDGSTGWASAQYLEDADGGRATEPEAGVPTGLPVLQSEMSARYVLKTD